MRELLNNGRETCLTGSTSPLSVRTIDPLTDPAWRDLLIECPAAGLFHSPPWIRAVVDAYGFRIRGYIATTPSGAAAGAVACCEIDDFAGRRLVSVPFSDACDPLVTSVDAWQELLSALQSHGLPVNLRSLWEPRVLATERIEIVKTARWHRIPIDGSTEEIWRRVAPETRRVIRQSERAGVEIRRLEGEGDRAAFHQLHVALRKTKYRLLAQPIRFFEALEKRFQEAGAWHSLGAYVGSRMIAGTIYLRWGDTLYYKFNASALDALNARPNNRLVWDGVLLAKSLGCRYLDLGPSDDDQPGLVRFKRNFGADEYELRFLRWTPENWVDCPERRQNLAEVTRSMTDPATPDEVAADAGAEFYRFFA